MDVTKTAPVFMTSPGSIGYIKMIELHDYVQLFLVIILVFVLWFFITIILDFSDFNTKQIPIHLLQKSYIHIIARNIAHLGWLEVLWTIIPIIILTAIAIPSFKLLYALDVVNSPLITLRCIGNQWYWAYECENTVPSRDEILQSFRKERNPFAEFYVTDPKEKWTHKKMNLINTEVVTHLFPSIDISKYFNKDTPRIDFVNVPTFNRYVFLAILEGLHLIYTNCSGYGLVITPPINRDLFTHLKDTTVNNIRNEYVDTLMADLEIAINDFTEDEVAQYPHVNQVRQGLLEEIILYQFKERRRRFTFNLRDLNSSANLDTINFAGSNTFLTDFSLSYTDGFEESKKFDNIKEITQTKYFKKMVWPLEKIQLKNKQINMPTNLQLHLQTQHTLLSNYFLIYRELYQLLEFIYMDINKDYLDAYPAFLISNPFHNHILSCMNMINSIQWIESFTIDSYMLDVDELQLGAFRLLETDNFPILPADAEIRLAVTGTDVIHSFAVPSLGVKIDAIPGRLNQFGIRVRSPGMYYGQCSELCGVGHGFMPIKLQFKKINR